jgi:hypothetical protein
MSFRPRWRKRTSATGKHGATKTPITAADLLNDKVLPLFEEHGFQMLRTLTDRGTEYSGRRTAFANAFTERSCRSFIRRRSARPFLKTSINCKGSSTHGLNLQHSMNTSRIRPPPTSIHELRTQFGTTNALGIPQRPATLANEMSSL